MTNEFHLSVYLENNSDHKIFVPIYLVNDLYFGDELLFIDSNMKQIEKAFLAYEKNERKEHPCCFIDPNKEKKMYENKISIYNNFYTLLKYGSVIEIFNFPAGKYYACLIIKNKMDKSINESQRFSKDPNITDFKLINQSLISNFVEFEIPPILQKN